MKGYFADDLEKVDSDVNWQADSLENGGGSTKEAAAASDELAKKQDELRAEAVKLAADESFDTVIFIGGQNHMQDLEGQDRSDMKLPYRQDELIQELFEVHPDMITVMVSGSPVEMSWIDQAKTLVWHWYAGMEGGTALAEVLFGRVNPSGKFPETFPVTHMDCSAHCIGEFAEEKTVKYSEGIFVGYRYYDTEHKKVLFPFGYGLSYTKFQYGNMKVTGNYPDVTVSVDVTNIGDMEGKEIVEIYVGKKDSEVERAVRELRGFEKLSLKPGETKTAQIRLDADAFTYYDEKIHGFVTEFGTYQIYAGKSVENICCEVEIDLKL